MFQLFTTVEKLLSRIISRIIISRGKYKLKRNLNLPLVYPELLFLWKAAQDLNHVEFSLHPLVRSLRTKHWMMEKERMFLTA